MGGEGSGADTSVLREYIKVYLKKGLSVIPLRYGGKEPLVQWKEFQKRRPGEEEIEEWFKKFKKFNIAIVCGRVSGNLVVIDFDSEEKFKAFIAKVQNDTMLKMELANTWIVKTGKGYHIYFRINIEPEEFANTFRTKPKLMEGVDIKAEGGYVVAPPSIHPSGVRYEFVRNEKGIFGPPEIPEPVAIIEDEWKKILTLLGAVERKIEKNIPRCTKKLSEEQVRKIVELIVPYYVKGHRDLIVYTLLGVLVKAGIDYESAKRVIELLVTTTNDEEAKHRLYLVDYHYGKRIETVGIERLKGVSGLREELENVLREQGLPEDEVVKRVSETIAELYTILGLRRGPGVAWLERKGGFIKKWVAVGRQGIYIFKRGGSVDDPTVQIVSNAVIRSVKGIRVLGLELKNLYMVNIDGEEVSGTVDEIVAYIEKHYGLERGAKYAIARLIEYTSEEEEELFYSPGPWVVNGKIVFAREPGYTPPWKHYVLWNPPVDEEIDEETKKEALIAIKNLVLAYRDPSKPSLVLSYASISPIMHYIKRVLNIAPHLIIHGLEGTGKTILLELIKLLFNITWEDTFPGSDFQARKCLATSTLPAIIDEIGSIIEGYVQGRKDAVEAVNVLHRAATQEVLRVSGGYTYGGYFLAVRTIIGATNSDVSLVPWQLDKFILVTISVKERVDLGKARGYTPRTMSHEIKKALPHIGVELLREVEKLLPQIEELRKLPRNEIRGKLVEIGYQAWRNLYAKYGLDPFPEPSKPETEIEKTSIREQYEDIFLSYIAKCMKGEIGLPFLMKFNENTINSEQALTSFNENLGVIIEHNEDGETVEELVCKTSFLTRFREWATREFGLPPMGWKRLAEILGMQRTRRTIGGKTIENLLVKRIK